MEKSELLRAKLDLPDGTLLEELGAHLSRTEGLDLRKIDPAELRNKAQQWLALNTRRIMREICAKWKLAERANDARYSDALFLASQIADVVAGLHSHIPAYTVSALLAKIGISELCRGAA